MTTNTDNAKEEDPPKRLHFDSVHFPGEPYCIQLINVFGGDAAHLNAIPREGLPGMYQVQLVLGNPGGRSIPENEIRFAQAMEGNSKLAIVAPAFPGAPKDATRVRWDIQSGTGAFVFEGHPNREGFLGKIEVKPFSAKNRYDAEIRATTAAQSLLSEITALLDVPLQIEVVEVTDVATGNKSLTVVAPFNLGGSSAPIEKYDADFSLFSALYREALNSTAPAYRYLCLYKILESIRKRRERLGRRLKQHHRPVRVGETVPATQPEQIAWLNAIFAGQRPWSEMALGQIFLPETRGKKVNALFDGTLRLLRDRIAHGILESGEPLYMDDLSAIREISRWLPFLRCAVRRQLKNDFPEKFSLF